jgi:nucleoside-diphosphate-sugar epimerase
MSLSGKRVLLTGGTGFIGSRLVEKLVLEHRASVRVLVRDFRHAVRIARFSLDMVAGDIRDARTLLRAMEGCDIVIHCAFGNDGLPKQQRAITVGGTEAVAKAAVTAKVRRLVHLSTISVYGFPGDGDLDESAPCRWTGDPYADSKIAAEQTVFRYHRVQGLPVVVIQPTIVYGPYSRPWTLRPLRQLKETRAVLIDGGSGLCNAVYVDDVVDAILLSTESEEAIGEAFLVSGEGPVTWLEFYNAYERMLGFTSTVAMSTDDIKKHHAKERKASRTIPQALRLLRDDGFRGSLLKLPAIRRPYDFLSSITPEWAWMRLRRLVNGDPQPVISATNSWEKPVEVPNLYLTEFCRAKTRVRIDKAKRLLGYRPAFDLERGMQLTAAWAGWANLI